MGHIMFFLLIRILFYCFVLISFYSLEVGFDPYFVKLGLR